MKVSMHWMFSMGYFYGNNTVLLCNFVRVCWLGDLIDSLVSHHKLRQAFRILENKPHACSCRGLSSANTCSRGLRISSRRKHSHSPFSSSLKMLFSNSSKTPTEKNPCSARRVVPLFIFWPYLSNSTVFAYRSPPPQGWATRRHFR